MQLAHAIPCGQREGKTHTKKRTQFHSHLKIISPSLNLHLYTLTTTVTVDRSACCLPGTKINTTQTVIMAAIPADTDCYEVLGVPQNATPGTIKKAYHEVAKTRHLDKGGTTLEFQSVRTDLSHMPHSYALSILTI